MTQPTRRVKCARPLREGEDFVYRATPREVRCVECAQNDPAVSCRPSLAWEAAWKKRAGRGERIAR